MCVCVFEGWNAAFTIIYAISSKELSENQNQKLHIVDAVVMCASVMLQPERRVNEIETKREERMCCLTLMRTGGENIFSFLKL